MTASHQGTALITGASSGIGAIYADRLARAGYDLILVARNVEKLDRLASRLVGVTGRRVDTIAADLTHRDDLARVESVLKTDPSITLLVNNAGVALGGRFDQVTLEEFDWVLAINFRAVVRLTHALLPVLRAHPGSHLVNVSSIFGILAPPGQAAYAASKFAVRGFSEALRAELAADGVGVTVVHPGGIRTRIAESARMGSGVDPEESARGKEQFAKLLRIPPEKAAALILTAIEKRRPRLLIGASAKIPDVLVRLFPGGYSKPLSRRR
jgi:short-subunit dehydrogenase